MKNQLKLSSIVALLMAIGAEVFLVRADVIDQQQPAIDISVGGLAIGGNSQQKLAQVVTCGFPACLPKFDFRSRVSQSIRLSQFYPRYFAGSQL